MNAPDFFSLSFLFLGGIAFAAGFMDAIVGGGGLIQVPALFVAFPKEFPATLFGTNKLSSIGGTFVAASKYLSKVQLPKSILITGGMCALVGSFLGAWLVTKISGEFFRQVLPIVLLALLFFTLRNKEMGLVQKPISNSKKRLTVLVVGTSLIGLYDGFFGPGTGMFLMFLFVQFLGYDFLHGSAATKFINCITNLAALLWFIPTGHINWPLAIWMMFFNVMGGLMGSTLAIAKGSTLVRKVFIFVVILLILKTSNDSYHWVKLIQI